MSLERQSMQILKKGSLSFHFASRLLGARSQKAIALLYAWCRHCDDQTDGMDPEGAGGGRQAVQARLLRLTKLSFREAPRDEPIFAGFSAVVRAYGIPAYYAEQLLAGMAMDADGVRYRSLEELRLYCYRVAGTVGLMASHVFGVSDQEALRHAADLGTAMQMTNIARDIVEDARMGRVYVPLTWLEESGIPVDEVGLPRHRAALAVLAERLVRHAEAFYRSGEAGLAYLPWRAALAVATARYVYADIGRQVVARGAAAWDSRTWVKPGRKVILLGKALAKVVTMLPARIARPWRPAPIHMIWRCP